MEFYLAVTLGLFGSLHCIGMCGPILLALPQPKHAGTQFLHTLSYHLTRSVSYACLGFIVGLFGDLATLLSAQKFVSLISGVLILFIVVLRSKWSHAEQWLYTRGFASKLRASMARLIRRDSLASQLKLGFLNGLLPCGFVYVALASSLTQASALKSAGFMFFFGLGTLPLLLVYSIFSSRLRALAWLRSTAISTSFSAVLALLFILRGLELGIPYVSPEFDAHQTHVESSCCEK